MFIGWLLGSAALHALALGLIPYVELSDGLAGGDTMRVRLSPAGNVVELAIQGLGAAPALEPPETLFPRLDVPPDAIPLTSVPEPPMPKDDAGFSSLRDAFELDRRVIASLDGVSTLGVDETAPRREPELAKPTLSPPVTQQLSQRSDLEPVASLGNTSTAPSAEITAETIELPVPIGRPQGQTVETAQPNLVASASESTGEAIAAETSSGETPATGESLTTSASADLSTLVSLLHEEIARHKQYPSLAKRQQREGTATVSFALYPDGAIDQVNVVSSSGFGRLDKAALYAVSEAAPFEAAEHYLDRARHFKVNIVFSLR